MGSIVIKEQSKDPNAYSVEYRGDDGNFWWKVSLEATLALDITCLLDCLLNGKKPEQYGFCPF